MEEEKDDFSGEDNIDETEEVTDITTDTTDEPTEEREITTEGTGKKEYKCPYPECDYITEHRGAINFHIASKHKKKGKRKVTARYKDTTVPPISPVIPFTNGLDETLDDADDDMPVTKGPEAEYYNRRKKLISALEMLPPEVPDKIRKYIMNVWDRDANIRNDDRYFYDFLTQDVNKVTPRMATRVVNTVFSKGDRYDTSGPIPYLGCGSDYDSGSGRPVSVPIHRGRQEYHDDYYERRPQYHPVDRDRYYTEADVRERVQREMELFHKDATIKELMRKQKEQSPDTPRRIIVREQALDIEGNPIVDSTGKPVIREIEMGEDKYSQIYGDREKSSEILQGINVAKSLIPVQTTPQGESDAIRELKDTIKSLHDRLEQNEREKLVEMMNMKMDNRFNLVMEEVKRVKDNIGNANSVMQELRYGLQGTNLPPTAQIAIKELDAKVGILGKVIDKADNTLNNLIKFSHKANTPMGDTPALPPDQVKKIKEELGNEYVE